MAHTPGPWRKANYGWAIVAGENDSYYGGHWIAEVSEPKNIPVITAAPDLLAACEEILSLLPGAVYIVEDNYSDLASQIEQAKEKIEAAIAKAKGE